MSVLVRPTKLILSAGIAAMAACSLLVEKDARQCSVNSDCVSKGGAFAASFCREGACTAMLSEDCTELVTHNGKPLQENAIVFGVLAPLSGDNATDGKERVNLTKLAQSEFHTAAQGVPVDEKTPPRPIALLVCDQVKNAERAATHLAREVKVPGIIGPGFSGTTLTVAKNVTIPAGTLIMSPSATTPDLTSLVDNGLVWRTSSSFAPEATAFKDVVARMESDARKRASWQLDGTGKVRVAIVAKWDSYGKGLADRTQAELVINGALATDAANAPYFHRHNLVDPSQSGDASSEDIVNLVRTFAPHIVLLVGTAEVLSRVLIPLETTWDQTGAPFRPSYVIAEGAKLTDLVTQAGADRSTPSLSSRTLIFSPKYDDALYGSVRLAYQGQYNKEMPDIFGPPGSYDAFFLLALAASRSPAPPTGASLADGLKYVSNTSTGAVINPGTATISTGVSLMSAGKSVNYEGVSGHLDFDNASGEALGDYALYCVTAGGYVNTGVYFDTASSTLSAALPTCP